MRYFPFFFFLQLSLQNRILCLHHVSKTSLISSAQEPHVASGTILDNMGLNSAPFQGSSHASLYGMETGREGGWSKRSGTIA